MNHTIYRDASIVKKMLDSGKGLGSRTADEEGEEEKQTFKVWDFFSF